MTNEQPDTREKQNHNYNYPNDSAIPNTTRSGQIDVDIPVQITEFDGPTARALLHLLVEVHRKRNLQHQPTTEEI